MANDEHLAMLKKDVKAWNDWRKEHSGIVPNLIGTDLRRANLRGANLGEVDLIGADLRRANLGGANLIWTELVGANLSRANLRGANLSKANLRRADLTDAIVGWTTFGRNDLGDVKGLDT